MHLSTITDSIPLPNKLCTWTFFIGLLKPIQKCRLRGGWPWSNGLLKSLSAEEVERLSLLLVGYTFSARLVVPLYFQHNDLWCDGSSFSLPSLDFVLWFPSSLKVKSMPKTTMPTNATPFMPAPHTHVFGNSYVPCPLSSSNSLINLIMRYLSYCTSTLPSPFLPVKFSQPNLSPQRLISHKIRFLISSIDSFTKTRKRMFLALKVKVKFPFPFLFLASPHSWTYHRFKCNATFRKCHRRYQTFQRRSSLCAS